MLPPKDCSRLIKLLNLTDSSNDHECLAAIRQANAVRAKNRATWAGLLLSENILSFADPESSDRDPSVRKMFHHLISEVCVESEFVLSLFSQWKKNKRLSTKQVAILKKIYTESV